MGSIKSTNKVIEEITAQRQDKSKNIMKSLDTNNEVDLITEEEVRNQLYGQSNNSLKLDNLYICNISGTYECVISLYLKMLMPIKNPKINTEMSYDPKIHIVEPGVSDETYSYHYFCKDLTIPIGAAVQFGEEIFKGIDFLSHSLHIIGNSNSEGSATLNINY
tara:strand:- start:26 stop:514 length:489 start_codon:yes stop_codon:yes gene_type:complete